MLLNRKLLRNVVILSVACLALSTTGCKKKSSKKSGSKKTEQDQKKNNNKKQAQSKFGRQVTEGNQIIFRGTDKVFQISAPKTISAGQTVTFEGRCDQNNQVQLTWTFPASTYNQFNQNGGTQFQNGGTQFQNGGTQTQNGGTQQNGQTVTRQGNRVSYTFGDNLANQTVTVSARCNGGSNQTGQLRFKVQPRTGTTNPNQPGQTPTYGSKYGTNGTYGGTNYYGNNGGTTYYGNGGTTYYGNGGSCSGSTYRSSGCGCSGSSNYYGGCSNGYYR